MTEVITSAQNPKIKKLLALQKSSSERRESALFVVEGRRELERCIASGFHLDSIFWCPQIAGSLGEGLENCHKIFEISPELYAKVALRESTEGIVAEVLFKEIALEDLKLGENPLIVVLEGVEKPGNLGAVIRSADAAGASAVIICDPLTDLFNPNLIRASVGAVFTTKVLQTTSSRAISWLKANRIAILTAQLQDSHLYYDTCMTRGTAIVIGTEATGLKQQWRDAADAHIRIPMLGVVDSLNASVSAAVLLYEAVRQRQTEID